MQGELAVLEKCSSLFPPARSTDVLHGGLDPPLRFGGGPRIIRSSFRAERPLAGRPACASQDATSHPWGARILGIPSESLIERRAVTVGDPGLSPQEVEFAEVDDEGAASPLSRTGTPLRIKWSSMARKASSRSSGAAAISALTMAFSEARTVGYLGQGTYTVIVSSCAGRLLRSWRLLRSSRLK